MHCNARDNNVKELRERDPVQALPGIVLEELAVVLLDHAHARPGDLGDRVNVEALVCAARDGAGNEADAEARFGASVFWIRQGMLQEAQMEEFLETWQTKRDGTRRGLLEVRP